MKLFLCSIAEFKDLYGVEYLLSARRNQIQRFLHQDDRARCLVAGLLLRYALGEQYGKGLRFGPHGKPYLNGDSPCFNLSHAGDYVALAVSPFEVGVDIEKVLPYSKSIAKKCFTAKEQQWLDSRHEDRAFYTLWTGKESVMKATGLGFAMPPEEFDVLPVLAGAHLIDGKTWYLQWHSLENYELCTASAAEETLCIIPVGRSQLV